MAQPDKCSNWSSNFSGKAQSLQPEQTKGQTSHMSIESRLPLFLLVTYNAASGPKITKEITTFSCLWMNSSFTRVPLRGFTCWWRIKNPRLSCPIWQPLVTCEGPPRGLSGKESTYQCRRCGSIPGLERSPGEGNATHCSFLAWEIRWTEKTCGLPVHGITWESNTTEQLNNSHMGPSSTWHSASSNWDAKT